MSTTGKPETILQAPLAERIIAAAVDLAIVGGICLFPRIGWIVGLIYHLMRDALPFMKGQSFGKKLMQLQVIMLPQQESLVNNPEKSIIRGIVSLVPVLNLLDVWFLFSRGSRLADKWAETAVVRHSDVEN